ncbi:MAG: formimidoylglutamase [Flavobacteriia bacterium]|nr:formimidoylglutamase [Flavobacteriia bacterium]
MALDFLLPVSDSLLAHNALLPPQAVGNKLSIHSEKAGMPSLDAVQLVIIGVNESRNAFEKKTAPQSTFGIRQQLYKLMYGNWNAVVADLGDVPEGAAVSDTYFVVKDVVATLLGLDIIPIVIGATQDISYPIYRSFDLLNKMVNMVSIDSRFDFGAQDALISSHSYMSRIITEKPNILHNFTNLGYQSYFNAQEEMDLMDKLFFEGHRLGVLTQDISKAEPILRNAHFVSVDARAIRAADMGSGPDFSPNGFDGREICALSRYAGLSESVMVFGLFEGFDHPTANQLMAQMIWYFMEGFSFRIKEHPLESPEAFLKFTVTQEDLDLVFFKSMRSQRWWVSVPLNNGTHTKEAAAALLACNEKDYLDACQDKIPESWFKAQKKGFI